MNKETIKEEKWMQKSLRQIKYSGQARNQDNKQQQATTTRLKVDPKKNQTNKQTKKKKDILPAVAWHSNLLYVVSREKSLSATESTLPPTGRICIQIKSIEIN